MSLLTRMAYSTLIEGGCQENCSIENTNVFYVTVQNTETHVSSCYSLDLQCLPKAPVLGFQLGTVGSQGKLEEVDPGEKSSCHYKVTSKGILGLQSVSVVMHYYENSC